MFQTGEQGARLGLAFLRFSSLSKNKGKEKKVLLTFLKI